MTPAGSERDLHGLVAGVEVGQQVLVWQRCELRDQVEQDDVVVLRMRWSGELPVDAGALKRGTVLNAWCVGHYRVVEGLIAELEQHDCYEAVG